MMFDCLAEDQYFNSLVFGYFGCILPPGSRCAHFIGLIHQIAIGSRNLGFEYYHRQDYGAARRYFLAGIYYDKSWMKNKGGWSVIAKSFLGKVFSRTPKTGNASNW